MRKHWLRVSFIVLSLVVAGCSGVDPGLGRHQRVRAGSGTLAVSLRGAVVLRSPDGTMEEIARVPAGFGAAELTWNDEGTRLAWWSPSSDRSRTWIGVYQVGSGTSSVRSVASTEVSGYVADVAIVRDALYAVAGPRLLRFSPDDVGGRLRIGDPKQVPLGRRQAIEVEAAGTRVLVAAVPSEGGSSAGGPGMIMLVDPAGKMRVLADDSDLESDDFTYNSAPRFLRWLRGSGYIYSGTISAGGTTCDGATGLLRRSTDDADVDEALIPDPEPGVSRSVYAVEADSRGRVLVVIGSWPFDCVDPALESVPVVYQIRAGRLTEIARGFVWAAYSQGEVAALKAILHKDAGTMYPLPSTKGADLVVGPDLSRTKVVAHGVFYAAWAPRPSTK